jgi:tetratricopeptide (TPR) repeat protein
MGLSIRGEWNQVVEIFTKLFAGEKGDQVSINEPQIHAYIAASLRRAGLEDEAVVHDGWAEKLSLGDPRASMVISDAYAFGGDMERSNRWLERYAIESPPASDTYGDLVRDNARDAYHRYSVHLLEQGKWKESAALSEAMALRASDVDGNFTRVQFILSMRLKADLPLALSRIDTHRDQALGMLDRCHSLFPGVGTLADYFYPALRKAGLLKEHDQYFESSWKFMSALLKRFPRSEQNLNGAAWLAARAVSRLPEAEAFALRALQLNPDQPAFLDTLGEVHFAKKDRKGAVKWSTLATNFDPEDAMIRRQYVRFSTDPFPGD